MLSQDTSSADQERYSDIWGDMITLISESETIVLTTHENSDGDGLGSEVGLYFALENLGKRVHILNPTEIPKNYEFLFEAFGDLELLVFSPENQDHLAILNDADLFLVLDTNSLQRIGALKDIVLSLQKSSALKIGCIDHHLDPQSFADVMICLSYASATGELIYDLIYNSESLLKRPIFNQKSAIGIYTALMTDTGSFRFPKTTPHVHQIAAKLIELGVEPSKIHKQVYSIPYNAMKLIGLAISSIHLEMNGKIAYLLITRQMFQQTSTSRSDTEKIAEYLMSISSIDVGVVFIEEEDGNVKMSLRSHGDIYINRVAKKFGGGGHKNAAGCKLKLPSYKAIQTVLTEIQQLLKEPYLNPEEKQL